jgi:uncharacterized protein with NAD-binding domain and iron-sulfur cluster
MPTKKTKVAVLGGGIGSLAAAYELSKTAQLQQQYEVTVYQTGWRLGGKGASGRRSDMPDGFNRIEEHGLHIWLGNYQNAFLLMQDCYDYCRTHGLTPSSPFQTWEDAFKGHSQITMMEQINGGWSPWQILMPAPDGWPGVAEQCLSLVQLVRRALELLRGVKQGMRFGYAPSALAHLDLALASAARLEAGVPHVVAELESLRQHVERFRAAHRAGNAQRIARSDVQRRRWILIDLATTLVLGVLADVLIPGHDSLDVLDDLDFRDWLARKGAEPSSINSAPVRNAYEIVFGYRDGDDGQPSFAAGTAVRFLLRWVVTYRGAFIYEMQAGMGDVVFTPLYLTLKDRGVGFQFFHCALSLHLDASKRNVARICLAEQVCLTTADYDPLINVNGLLCWPAEPRYEFIDAQQAADLKALKAKYPGVEPLESSYSTWVNYRKFDLNWGDDFDKVVLGISLGALPAICSELIAANARFNDMVNQIGTVATQSFQLWLEKDAVQLGFQGSESAILDSYRDSFADFSHLIPRESFPSGTVGSIGFFCKSLIDQGPIPPAGPNPGYEQGATDTVKAWSRDTFLNGVDGMRPIWPNAYDPGSGQFLWDLLVDLRSMPGVGSDRFDAQYWRANVNLSSRYVQALTGTTKYRLKASESGFDNLVMAGDWTRTGINAGCIEGATVGGMQAARAISGWPQQISGENDFCRHGRLGCAGALAAIGGTIAGVFRQISEWLKGPSPPQQSASVLPPYVERGGEQVFPPPFLFEDCVIHAFLVQAEIARLKALCDKHLNGPLGTSGLEYLPVTDHVVVGRLDAGRAFPQPPTEYDYGYIREADVALFIPVIAIQDSVPVGLGLFPPYLFVDHPWGVLSGREVYGLPKIPSKISQINEGGPILFEASSFAAVTLGTAQEVQERRVLSILTDGQAPVQPGHVITDRQQAWEAIVAMLFGRSFEINVAGNEIRVAPEKLLKFGTLPLISLKQFRDVANGRAACYQSVIDAPAQVTKLVSVEKLTASYQLQVEQLVSHPIRGEFGWNQTEAISTALRIELNFVIGAGTEVG